MSLEAVVQRYRLEDRQPVSVATAFERTRRLAQGHYENFSVVSLLLPRAMRQHYANIYAYCRVSDDLADEVGSAEQSLGLLRAWRAGLNDMYGGWPGHWVFVALAETVRAFDIPAEPFVRLLDAFEQDQRQSRYQSFDELLDYCTKSANPVGHLVLYLAGHRDSERFNLSDQTCTALQLVNFWQDVSRDWEKGRVYLPQADMARFGVTEAHIAEQRFEPACRELMAFECARTRAMFDRGLPLLDQLSGSTRQQVSLFSGGGLALLRAIAARDYDTFSGRPTVGRTTKLALVLRALLGLRP